MLLSLFCRRRRRTFRLLLLHRRHRAAASRDYGISGGPSVLPSRGPAPPLPPVTDALPAAAATMCLPRAPPHPASPHQGPAVFVE